MTSVRKPFEIDGEAQLFAQEIRPDHGGATWIFTRDPECPHKSSPFTIRSELCELVHQLSSTSQEASGVEVPRTFVEYPSVGSSDAPMFLEVSRIVIAGKEHWRDGDMFTKPELEARLGVDVPVEISHAERLQEEFCRAELPTVDLAEVPEVISSDLSDER